MFTLLFCTDASAKAFVSKAISARDKDAGPSSAPNYLLVETKECPSTLEGFKQSLHDGEDFVTEFLGSTEEECQAWALAKQTEVKFIEKDFKAIADARSAQDNAILLQQCAYKLDSPDDALEFEGYGRLPPEREVWYSFRVPYEGAPWVNTSLLFGPINSVYRTFYGRKQEITDDAGIIDWVEARRLVMGKENTDRWRELEVADI